MKNFIARITETEINIQQAYEFIQSPSHGAATSFLGIIRNRNLGRDVIGVSYDVFIPLAERTLQDLCKEAQQQWGSGLKLFVEHFKGRLEVGGVSVIVAVSSPHRNEAFQACRFLIEGIKHRSPIWKQEHYLNGDSEWVKGHALCSHS